MPLVAQVGGTLPGAGIDPRIAIPGPQLNTIESRNIVAGEERKLKRPRAILTTKGHPHIVLVPIFRTRGISRESQPGIRLSRYPMIKAKELERDFALPFLSA